MQDYAAIVQVARKAFATGRTLSKEFRKQQLRQLLKLVNDNEDALADALHKDLHKPRQEAILMEIEMMRGDISVALFNLDDWMNDKNVEKTVVTLMETAYLHYDPYGVTLVIGAWNYPLALTGSPLVGAISAGNCCIIKPSEISSHTADLFAELVPKYLDSECYPVVLGGPEETTELLKQRFDYVFYTGSTNVGRIVREAANKHLTPCTLELGGKSPVYVSSDCNIEVTAKRLMWGKLVNLGQTCVAPDYVLCSKSVQDQLINAIRPILKSWFGENPKESSDLGRIVNERNYSRIMNLLEASRDKVVLGGESNEKERFIAPTILVNVTEDDAIMKEEIFGPLLPFVNVKSVDEAIQFINKREKPLTMYVFSSQDSILRKMIAKTTAGSVCCNDTMIHLSVETLPFGGVGMSGMGSYHGKYSFETFSHRKSCLLRNFSKIGETLSKDRYPPYSEKKTNRLQFIMRKRKPIHIPYFTYIVVFLLGTFLSYLVACIID